MISRSYQAVQDALDCGKYFPLSIRTVHLLYKWNFPGTHIISKFPSLCYITQSLYFIIEANEQIEIYWLAGVFCSLWCNSPGRNEDIVKEHFSLSIWLSDYWKNGPPSGNFPRKLMTREREGINWGANLSPWNISHSSNNLSDHLRGWEWSPCNGSVEGRL